MSNDKEKKPRATAEQADRLEFLNAEIERVGQESDNYLNLLQERHELMYGYDWLDEVFEENGKKGLRNIRGEVVVPAIYDDFCMPRPYYLPMLLVGAKKGDKVALVKRDGKGTPSTDFEFHYVEPIPFTPFNVAFKSEDLHHFAIVVLGKVFTPYELVDYYLPCDDHVILKGDNDKYGIIGMHSLLYIAPEYDDIIDNGIGDDFTFIKDGVKGRVTMDKRFISDEEYDNLSDEEQDELYDVGFICAPDD